VTGDWAFHYEMAPIYVAREVLRRRFKSNLRETEMYTLFRRLTGIVIVITAAIVSGFLLWDSLAHLGNLVALPVDTGVIPKYGTTEYEMTASVVLTTVLLSFLLGIVAVPVYVILHDLEQHDDQSDTSERDP